MYYVVNLIDEADRTEICVLISSKLYDKIREMAIGYSIEEAVMKIERFYDVRQPDITHSYEAARYDSIFDYKVITTIEFEAPDGYTPYVFVIEGNEITDVYIPTTTL